MKLYLILSVVDALSARASCAADTDLLVSTKQGPVRGTQVHVGVNAFLGIPFAEPALGPLRFQPPQPLKRAHRRPLNATSFGPACYQFRYRAVFSDRISPRVPESEDCLNLNIYVPKRPRRERKKLPVYVWSYGGGFGEGSPSAAWYDPVDFVAENKDIIVVNWKYGFFPVTSFALLLLALRHPCYISLRTSLIESAIDLIYLGFPIRRPSMPRT